MKVTVCIGSSCHIKGSRSVVEQLQDLIAKENLNDKIELGGTFCMGKCQQGVCVTVDGEFFSVSPETVSYFFEKDCLTLKKSNCKNCYKCIRNCPVKSIRFSGNQAHIIGNECILCGRCFVVCPQNAKEIVDETEKVKVLIQSGDPVVVSLAPSFVANYEGVGIEAMREAWRKPPWEPRWSNGNTIAFCRRRTGM